MPVCITISMHLPSTSWSLLFEYDACTTSTLLTLAAPSRVATHADVGHQLRAAGRHYSFDVGHQLRAAVRHYSFRGNPQAACPCTYH